MRHQHRKLGQGRYLRSSRLRAVLWEAAAGRCAICHCPLPPGWHADHIRPYCHTGRTNVHEMQALCPRCNCCKGGHDDAATATTPE